MWLNSSRQQIANRSALAQELFRQRRCSLAAAHLREVDVEQPRAETSQRDLERV
jgi:hypothetical protein